MSQEQIEEVEIGIEQARAMVSKAAALDNLFSNKDFKTVIREGYLKEEAVRLVLLKADPGASSEDMQTNIADGIVAIGHFNQYLKTVQALGSMAAKSLGEYEDLRAELLVEGE
jgi:hypothetical protein